MFISVRDKKIFNVILLIWLVIFKFIILKLKFLEIFWMIIVINNELM